VKVVAGLELPFVPPRGADLGQWLDQFAGLGGITRAGATEDDLERGVLPVRTVLVDVGDEVTDLVHRWDASVPGGGEQGDHAVPARGSAYRSAVWPEPADPDRRAGALHRGGQQGDVPDP
jgi:hypothetical protein